MERLTSPPQSDPNYDGPWHAGERAAQTREGVREMMEEVGLRVLRPYMPEQHRTFFAQLPFIIVGSVDGAGQPWASVLANPPGFVSSPDPQHLKVAAAPLPGDPLSHALRVDAAVGLLGIAPHTRRRNRMNGIVERIDEQSFSVRVSQSFGNCPQYIQARKPEFVEGLSAHAGAIHRGEKLDARAREMVQNADTFFIATAYPRDGGLPHAENDRSSRAYGVDVSHRGGKPGFVRVEEDENRDDILTVPDFIGNRFFNTIGNLEVNPRAGLLFIDFEKGDLLYLAVEGEVIWDGWELESFEGAQRLMRLRVTRMQRSEAILPLRFGQATPSPFLEETGAWPMA